jgi:hypothetical protein
MPDARYTRGLVCNVHKEMRTRAYRAAEAIRHSLRNGFTAYFVLSPENGSFASVVTQVKPPEQFDASTATSGPHDLAVRVGAVRYQRYLRPPHPIPTTVTIMIRPSGGTGWL